MDLEQLSPLTRVVLLGFGSILVVFLVLWYMLRLPSWLARRKKLALHHATNNLADYGQKAQSFSTRATPATQSSTRAREPRESRAQPKTFPKRVASTRGYNDFKQQRQNVPSSKLNNDRFRGANVVRTEGTKDTEQKAKPKLPK